MTDAAALRITVASASQVPALSDLLSTLFAQEAEFVPNHAAQCRGLSLIIENPSIGHLLVAHAGERAIGMVGLLYTISTALGARVALLEDMVVAPPHRGAGIGSGLLRHAIAHARSQGCARVTLLTDETNSGAQRFYARHGFVSSPMKPLRLLLD